MALPWVLGLAGLANALGSERLEQNALGSERLEQWCKLVFCPFEPTGDASTR